MHASIILPEISYWKVLTGIRKVFNDVKSLQFLV